MSVLRWKVMAGVLSVSIGGLATLAGQAAKPTDAKKGDMPPAAPGGKVLPPAAAPLEVPTIPSVPTAEPLALPPLPGTTPAPVASAPKLPPVPPPASHAAPPAGLLEPPVVSADVGRKPEMVKPEVVIPVSGVQTPMTPPPGKPSPLAVEPPPPAADPFKAVPGAPMPSSPAPAPIVAAGPAVPMTAPTPAAAVTPPMPATAPALVPELSPTPAPSTPAVTTPAVATTTPVALQTKFRIILRVGEGEPMFEVRHGDDLVMKVLCEKVDIKSPEAGQGLSAVTATGKVRFVGFGSEGTCQQLSFLAGTGEVMMTGKVMIQVKDKLGRIESELSTESIKYRVDAASMPGALKP